MFDVGWSELVVIGVVSLVVIGPELPGVIRNVGRAVAKLRTMAGDFRSQFDEAMREADLADVQKSFTDAKDVATSAYQAATNPVSTLKDEIVSSVASINESAKSLEADLSAATNVTLPTAETVSEPAPTPVVEEAAVEAPAKPKRRKKPVEEAAAPEPVAEPAAEEAPKPKRRKKAATSEGDA